MSNLARFPEPLGNHAVKIDDCSACYKDYDTSDGVSCFCGRRLCCDCAQTIHVDLQACDECLEKKWIAYEREQRTARAIMEGQLGELRTEIARLRAAAMTCLGLTMGCGGRR